MLIAVAFRNLIEMAGSESDPGEALILPQSFGWSRRGNIVWRVFSVSLNASPIVIFLQLCVSLQ